MRGDELRLMRGDELLATLREAILTTEILMRLLQLLVLVVSLLSALSCNGHAQAPSEQIAHPDDPSKRVEYFVRSPAGKGPWPTIVFLHGHQDGDRPGGEDFVKWGVLDAMTKRGYLSVAVSQPGYGHSSGPADYCGDFTQHAVQAVITKLRTEGIASKDKLLIQGISRGALTAGLVAAQDPSVSGLILISGVYDLPTYVSKSKTVPGRKAIVDAITAEAGESSDALNARSVLPVADRIQATTLILAGERDNRADPDQARELTEKMTRSGKDVRLVVYPEHGHKIPADVRNKDVDPFLGQILGSAKQP
jgi:dipeptidyl aminopeptidase/acylaminoacyl peptidase